MPESFDPINQLLSLQRKSRAAESAPELAFLAVNETLHLAPYRQAVLWFEHNGVLTLSGILQVEANTPYVQWLERVIGGTLARIDMPQAVSAEDLPVEIAAEWSEWLPTNALWLPLAAQDRDDGISRGGVLLVRDDVWLPDEIALLAEWLDAWRHAYHALAKPPTLSLKRWREKAIGCWSGRGLFVLVALFCVLPIPVRLSVLAPSELVPANPIVIRAPLDGVVNQFHVQPNQSVKAGDLLLDFDDAALTSRIEVAEQALVTAQAEYRQIANMAFSDNKFKAQLAVLSGKIEEKQSEVSFLRDQRGRSRIVAPQDGVALFDDPSEWTGRPVQTGERILRLAQPSAMEIEVWLPMGDAIPLDEGADVQLYLAASPLIPVAAHVRYVAREASLRPDGSYAYRVRARLDEESPHRIGLKGTAKLSGEHVPFIYWVVRRPLAVIRQTLGI